jgi:hypothetical protein
MQIPAPLGGSGSFCHRVVSPLARIICDRFRVPHGRAAPPATHGATRPLVAVENGGKIPSGAANNHPFSYCDPRCFAMPHSNRHDQWNISDFWAGLLLLAAGAIVLAYTWLANARGLGMFATAGWFIGPVCLILGAVAIAQSLRSALRRDKSKTE